MDLTSTFAPIAKYTDQDDGSLMVYGKATDGGLDLDDQRCDPAWLSTAMPEWFSSAGNIRAQHNAHSAVGKAIEHTSDSDGHYITARIVDRDAIAKTKAGVFTGFSIGIRRPKIVKSPDAPNGLINGGMITEVSLCDRPANPACTLMLCKAATNGWEGRASDFDADRGLVKCEDMNFFPENNIVLKTVAEPITSNAATEPTTTIEPFVPAEAKAPVNPTFSDAEKSVLDIDAIDARLSEVIAQNNKALTEAISRQGAEADFDREAAIALVNKASDGLGQNESGDIDGASAAIAQIAQLIISEAKDLAKMPAQGCDIHLLMSAVDALRCFSRREQMEQAGTDPDSVICLAADTDVEKAKYSADELKAMLKAGKAMKNPNGDPSYPIGDKDDLSNAIHAVGRGSGDHDEIRSYIKRRASALGASDMIPESWTKMAEATTTKADNVSDSVTDSAAEDVAVVDKAATEEVAQDAEKSVEADTETPGVKQDDVDVMVTKSVGDIFAALFGALAEVEDDDDSTEKTAAPELAKGASSHAAALVKALASAAQKTSNPIHKSIQAIAEATTKSAVEALSAELGARLEKVEQMATPGGPALRRTEVERVNARKSDLIRQSAHFKALASATEDDVLRKGYVLQAHQFDAEIKAL